MFDLKRFIKDRGISQFEFASIIGKSPSAISKVITGILEMPIDWIDLINDHFDVNSEDYIITDPPDMVSESNNKYEVEISLKDTYLKIIEEQTVTIMNLSSTIINLTSSNTKLIDIVSHRYMEVIQS